VTAPGTGIRRIDLRGACPIPVGHRIEVRIFLSEEKVSFFGNEPAKPLFETPLITDLETGVRYGSFEQFHAPLSMYQPGQIVHPATEPLPHLRDHSRWAGRVLACNVLYTGMSKNELQTTLVVEPLPPGSPGYR
jgi:hypothetical protein